MIDYLDRIGTGYEHEQWIVRVDAVLGIARVYDETDDATLSDIEGHARPWIDVGHPHLVPVLAVQRDGARLVIVSGDERGPSFLSSAKLLADAVERVTWATAELAGVADAIAMMRFRDRDFVHRNAHDGEIVVGSDGRALLRSCAASYTAQRGRAWTGRVAVIKPIGWLSPEQALGYALTPASDVFTLASTLYAAVTLTRPFARKNDFDTLKAIAEAEPPPPPACAPALAKLIMRNLARDPGARDATPGVFAEHLRAIVPEPSPVLRARVAAARSDRKPAPHDSAAIAGFRCAKQWEELTPTTSDGIRHCAECKHDVVLVRSLRAVIPLLGRRCISYIPE